MILQLNVKLKFEPKLANKFGQLCHLYIYKKKINNKFVHSFPYLFDKQKFETFTMKLKKGHVYMPSFILCRFDL